MIKIVNDIKEAKFITHSGVFHADDVFATAFLDLYYKNILFVFLYLFVSLNSIKYLFIQILQQSSSRSSAAAATA